MDTSAKISCCKTCLLAENMKACKVCQFNAGLEIVTVTKRPTYDELIHGAKFTDEHRAELRDWWNKKYDNREEAKRLNVLR